MSEANRGAGRGRACEAWVGVCERSELDVRIPRASACLVEVSPAAGFPRNAPCDPEMKPGQNSGYPFIAIAKAIIHKYIHLSHTRLIQ